MKHLPYLLFASAIVCGCGGDSGTVNTPAGTELRATDFLMPKQAGSQTMFRVWHFVTDTNGVRDTAFGGTISYIMADSAFRFSPTITATLILIGGSDSAGVKLPGYDSLYVFTDGGQLRISTYHGDSVGRRLIAEPIRAGATFRRGNDTTTANIVTIEHINTPVQTPIRTFSAVKTKRKFLSEIEDTRRELIVENYLAPGQFLVKQHTTDIATTISTGRSSVISTRFDLFFKNF